MGDEWDIILDEVGVGGKIFWVGGGEWGELHCLIMSFT